MRCRLCRVNTSFAETAVFENFQIKFTAGSIRCLPGAQGRCIAGNTQPLLRSLSKEYFLMRRVRCACPNLPSTG
jgi:hypothetical protein